MTTRNDALLWLSDHRGQEVTVSFSGGEDFPGTTLFEIRGDLTFWRDGLFAGAVAAIDPEERREDLAGMYKVDNAMLDLTEIPPTATIEVGDLLRLVFPEGTELEVRPS